MQLYAYIGKTNMHWCLPIKSIPTCFQTSEVTGIGCNSAFLLSSLAFTRWQVSHRLQYSSMSLFIPFHQYASLIYSASDKHKPCQISYLRVCFVSTIVASIITIMASTDNPNLFFLFCNNPLQTEVSTYILSFVEKQPILHFKQSSLLAYPLLFVRSKSCPEIVDISA